MNKLSRFPLLAEADPLKFNLVETAAVLNSRFSEMYYQDITHNAKEAQDWLEALFFKEDGGIRYCTDATGPVLITKTKTGVHIDYIGKITDNIVGYHSTAFISFENNRVKDVSCVNGKDLGFISDILDPYYQAIVMGNISKLDGPLLQQALNFQMVLAGKLAGGFIHQEPKGKHYTTKFIVGL